MNPSLLRHGVFPLLDAFNRTRIGQVLAFLEASNWRDGLRSRFGNQYGA